MAHSSSHDKKDEMLLVLRVIKARMLRSFEMFGQMDPQATVHWTDVGQKAVEISKTRVDWNGHLNPKWEHTCRGRPFPGVGSGVSVEFKVFEADVIGAPTFCGSATCSVDELVTLPTGATVSSEPTVSPIRELKLLLPKSGSDTEHTGSITVQAILVSKTQMGTFSGTLSELTKVNTDMFETPVHRLQVSGGTAPFFNLYLKKPKEGQSRTHFIGKDLSHAADEINFYEEILRSGLQGNGDLGTLLGYVPEYAGVLTAAEAGTDQQRDLIVMRNLKDNQQAARMLDIKMGQRTGQAGWQGKSRTAAFRQALVDGITNTSGEGFRLEGFDSEPAALQSMDPLLDIGSGQSKKTKKKAHRLMLQRMQGSEMMMHYLDVHKELLCPDDNMLQSTLAPSEYTELVLAETVKRLCHLALTCRKVPVPQKWIGSSVALGFDVGALPARSASTEEQVRRNTLVAIFDWGRSELNTLEKHILLSEADQMDRSEFWAYYVGGMDRLAWEAVRAYKHRYTISTSWADVIFVVHDFDSLTANDFLCKLRVTLEETPQTTKDLVAPNGSKRGRLTYSISWQAYPSGSRLKGAWQVKIFQATNIPASDGVVISTSSDPFIEVVAVSAGEAQGFRQVSEVKVRSLSPDFGGETFEIPIVARPDMLSPILTSAGLPGGSNGIGGQKESALFPLEEAVLFGAGRRTDPKAADKAFRQFVQEVDRAALEQVKKEGGDVKSVAKLSRSRESGDDIATPGEVGVTLAGIVPETDQRDAAERPTRDLKEPTADDKNTCGCTAGVCSLM